MYSLLINSLFENLVIDFSDSFQKQSPSYIQDIIHMQHDMFFKFVKGLSIIKCINSYYL